DHRAFFWPQGDSLESLQLLHRPDQGCIHIAEVNLNDFAPLALATILELDRQLHSAVADVDFILFDPQFAISELGVTEAVAKRVLGAEMVGDRCAAALEL